MPVFLRAEPCVAPDPREFPEALTLSPVYLVKRYTTDERIACGTGAIVPAAALPQEIAARLALPGIAFVDIRSARNICWQVRARPG